MYIRKSKVLAVLRDEATRCIDTAESLCLEVKRGECIRQSAESKLARAEVLKATADKLHRIATELGL